MEIHPAIELKGEEERQLTRVVTLAGVIIQIFLLDLVFSLDSVVTAIGMPQGVEVMAKAIVIAIVVMLLSSEVIRRVIPRYRSIKILALSFLLMIGITLITEGFSRHLPKGCLYLAMGFSGLVWTINLIAGRRRHLAARD